MFFKKEKKNDKDGFKKELIEEIIKAKSNIEEETFKNDILELTNGYVKNFDISNIIEWVKEKMMEKAREGDNCLYIALDENKDFYNIGSELNIDNVSTLKARISFKIIQKLESYGFDVDTVDRFFFITKEDYTIRIYWSK